MPLYEYACDGCGGRFEVIQKLSEVTEECRLCGKGPVRRLQSAPAFQFKGTGWYVTDYAQKGKSGGDSDKKGGGETSAEGKKSDGGSDTSKSEASSTSTATPASTKGS